MRNPKAQACRFIESDRGRVKPDAGELPLEEILHGGEKLG